MRRIVATRVLFAVGLLASHNLILGRSPRPLHPERVSCYSGLFPASSILTHFILSPEPAELGNSNFTAAICPPAS
jgi:hypothetical protein